MMQSMPNHYGTRHTVRAALLDVCCFDDCSGPENKHQHQDDKAIVPHCTLI